MWDALTADDYEHSLVVAKIQAAHARHGIEMQKYNDLNQATMMLLAIFVPTLGKFGWRKMSDIEVRATGLLIRRVANSMNIDFEELARKEDYDGLEIYERIRREASPKLEHCAKWSETNRYLAKAWMDAMSPKYLSRLFQEVWKSLIEEKYLKILGWVNSGLNSQNKIEAYCTLRRLSEPPRGIRIGVCVLLHIRAWIVRNLFLPRSHAMAVPFLTIDPKTRRRNLNTWINFPWYVRSTWWTRWSPLSLLRWLMTGKRPGPEYCPEGYSIALDIAVDRDF